VLVYFFLAAFFGAAFLVAFLAAMMGLHLPEKVVRSTNPLSATRHPHWIVSLTNMQHNSLCQAVINYPTNGRRSRRR